MSIEIQMQTAHAVADALFDGEAAIERALGRTAAIVSAMAESRAAAGLSVFHGQEAIQDGSELMILLSEARAKFGGLHKRLAATQRQVGLRHVAFGDVPKPVPGPKGVEDEDMRPRLVSTAA